MNSTADQADEHLSDVGVEDSPDEAAPHPPEDEAAPHPQQDVDPAVSEVTRAFDVPRRWLVPRLAGVGPVGTLGAARRSSRTTTYVDTPGLGLAASGRTLTRGSGASAGWCFSDAGDGLPVREPASGELVPAALRTLVNDTIGLQPLVPVAILRRQQAERELLDAAGTRLGTLTDETVEANVLIGEERVLRWRSVTLHLSGVADDDVDTIVEALTRSHLTPTSVRTALERIAAEVPLDPRAGDATAGQIALRYVAAQLGVLQGLDQAVRDDAPDAVHKMRVATRRLRSALRTYRDLVDRSESEPLRAEVAWLTGALGEPRDAEVLAERIMASLDAIEPELIRGPVRIRIESTLRADHEAAHARLITALDSRRHHRLIADLVEFVARPAFAPAARHPAAESLPPYVTAATRAVIKDARRAQRATDPAERDEYVHDIRKRAKAARYAAEAAGVAVGKQAKRLADAWTDLQEALGHFQDSVVAREVLERLYREALAAGEDTFTYGVLVEREAAIGRDVLAQYDALLQTALARAAKLDDTQGKKRRKRRR